MKKKHLVILLVLVFEFGIGIGVDKLLFDNKQDIDENKAVVSVKNKNVLSMMLETDSGSGEYNLETRSSWPTKEGGYIFNSTLSKYEKGSKLSWDDINNVVVMVGTTSDKCYVYFDVFIPFLMDVCSSGDNLASCVKAYATTYSSDKTSVYYHDTNLTNGAGDNSYRYAGSDYRLTEKANLNGITKIDFVGDTSTDALISFYCNNKKSSLNSQCSFSYKSYYSLQYDTNNVQYDTYEKAIAKAVSDGYLIPNVNNYVCFGSSENICPDDNLYRIIGIFGEQVKLIKWDYATISLIGGEGVILDDYENGELTISYYKGSNSIALIGGYFLISDGSNMWSISDLNIINLNTNFINNIGSTWANKIATTTWRIGGNTSTNIVDVQASGAYENEYINPAKSTTYTDRIALMYTSDYGFAASPSGWTKTLNNYHEMSEENWMHMGLHEYTVVCSEPIGYWGETGMFYISGSGEVFSGDLVSDLSVRPVFYLNSEVTYVSGNGTKNNPVRIN